MAFRQDKINEQVTRELTEILRTVKDPRVSGTFVSISAVEVTRDLSLAKIYYSVLGEDKGVKDGLSAANGYIRRELAHRLNLRITPKLVFLRDNSAERAINIAEILKEVLPDGSDNQDNQDGSDRQD